MVDPTTDFATEAPEIIHMDELDRLAEINYGKVLAVIKLWQRGATKLRKLPKDVFRCILERQISMRLLWRYSDPYMSINGRQLDRHFPDINKLCYDNYLVAVNEIPASTKYLFILKNGAICGTKGSFNWRCLKVS